MHSFLKNCSLLIHDDSRAGQARESYPLHSPADGEKIAEVEIATEVDLEHAVQEAQIAFGSWSKLTGYQRAKMITSATAHARSHAADIGHLMALEQGKPAAQSTSEVLGACDTLDYYAAEGVRIEGYTNSTENPQFRSTVIYQPVGVCGLITPWNYPVALLSWKLGPALATGCSVIVKPSPVSPLSPTAFCQALIEGGLPPGLISVLNAPGAALGEAMIKHPGVKKIAMTGSTAVGKKILAAAAPYLKKVTLELGGHCPAIVCADADLDLASEVIAYKGFRNCGQSCSAVNRVYAHHSIHDALVKKLKVIADRTSIGDGLSNPKVDLGPMTLSGGPERCREHIREAVSQGAKLITGGAPPEGAEYERGNYFRPTILTDCKQEMKIMREETFGPVVPFASFDTCDEAVNLANDSRYGLVSYLFTRDHGTILRISEALESGTICVNNGAVNANYSPYAGWKDSGYGVELSRSAVFEYLKPKHIKTAVS